MKALACRVLCWELSNGSTFFLAVLLAVKYAKIFGWCLTVEHNLALRVHNPASQRLAAVEYVSYESALVVSCR